MKFHEPNSGPAEESVISCIMIDGKVVEDCIAAGLTTDCFHDPINRATFSKQVELYLAGCPTSAESLAAEAGANIKSFGGYLNLTRISDKLPSTATARLHIRTVKDMKAARLMLASALELAERASMYRSGDGASLESALSDAESALYAVRSQRTVRQKLKPITEFVPPVDDDDATLIGDRFLCRGHGSLVVGGSGMGKSTLAYQASVAWGLGRHFLGIQPAKKLVSLHIQAEDEEGDIGEVWRSIFEGQKLSEEDVKIVRQNVIIRTEKVARGSRFLQELKMLCNYVKPDIVWLNPLHAYMDGDIKDAQAVGAFCREGLAGINTHDRWAYIIVHHTPKPATGRDKGTREWNEIMYEAAGSADLVNWARAVIVLKATTTEGNFDLHLAKRGKRAGVVKEITDAAGNTDWEVTTRIPIRHSKGKINIPGRAKPLPLLYWEPRQEELPATPEKKEEPKRKRERNSCSDEEFATFFPESTDEFGVEFDPFWREATSLCGISKREASRRRAEWIEDGRIEVLDTGRMRLTESGKLIRAKWLVENP